MVEDSWRNFVWVCAALAGLDLFLIFLVYPESSFVRPEIGAPGERRDSTQKEELDGASQVIETRSEKIGLGQQQHGDTVKVSFPKVWMSFWHRNPMVNLPRAFMLPFVFLGCVPVLWTILVYGGVLASQIIVM
jgi:hypothetical protein